MAPRPMLATPSQTLPVGPEWSYEIKWDGYRAIVVKDETTVRIISRHGKNLTADYPGVVRAVASLASPQITLDGEIVALDAEGHPSFQALQHRRTADRVIAFYAFDLLALNGESWERQPIEARRRQLARELRRSNMLLSSPLEGDPKDIEQVVRGMGLEGIVAKRLGSPYRQGQRSEDWLKVRFSPRQEFVIGGFEAGGTAGLDSLIVGYYKNGGLLFAARVRAGLTSHQRRELLPTLERILVQKCPFVDLPNARRKSRWGAGITPEDMLTLQWVRPRLVVEVSFVEWTRDGVLRHPKYEGFRIDKKATDVRRET